MEVVFQILIALLASRGQSGAVTATNNSSLSVELYVSVPSAYLSPKHNYTSTFGTGEQAHRSGGGHSVPTHTDTADHTVKAANVNSESVPGQAADSQTARGTTLSLIHI